jgi:hypothetical protein
LLVGCSKTETTTNNSTPANDNKAMTKASPASNATTASSGEKIGVAECDEFIAAYEACVSGKVPEAARPQFKTAIEQWRSSWHKLAANPATKPTLAAACKQSAEQARASMKAYGCAF